MGKGNRVAALLLVIVVARTAQAQESRPSIDVILYDHAAAGDVVDRSKAMAERIFAGAGVVVRWLEPGAPMTVASPLRVLVRRHADDPTMKLMGKALEEPLSCGGVAYVFYATVLEWAHRSQQDVAAVLAYAVAHELGHLLLPAPAHADAGVMRPHWDGDDFRHIGNGSLKFAPHQAQAIADAATKCGQAAGHGY